MRCPKCNSEMRLVKHKGNMEKYVCLNPSCKHPMTIYSSQELKLEGIYVKSDSKHWL